MRRLRWSTLLAAGAVCGAVLLPAGSRPAVAGAEAPSNYEATAVADGVRVSTNIPGAPLSDGLLDVSSASAGARIDALGASRAFAAAPYPGATLTNLLDVLRGATGAPIPTYPLIAASDYPGVPETSVAQPGLNLHAKSAPAVSEARLVTGGDGGEAGGAARSVGSVRTAVDEAGGVVAEATMETTGLQVGPVTIAKVASRARMTRAAGGEPQREQAVEVTGLSIADQTVGLGPEGLVVAGTKVPVPDTDPVRKALEQAGITLRYLEVADSPDGIVSAGLMVTQVLPASPTGPPSTVIYVVGRASATVVTGAATPPALAESPLPPVSAGEEPPAESSPPPAAPASTPESPTATASAASSSTPAFAAGEPGAGVYPDVATRAPSAAEAAALAPPAPTSSSVAAAAPAGAAASLAATAAANVSPASRAWSPDPLYLVMLLPGAVLLGAFLVLRRMGVKTTWAS